MKVPPFEEAPFLDPCPPQGGSLLAGLRRQVRGIRCPVSVVGFLGQDYRRVVMGLPPTRANENHPSRPPRQAPESQHREARVRSPRIEEKRTCGKDVKNRGNELNNSFGINKSVKKTNSKRTGFACKDEQLKATNGPNSAREAKPESRAECAYPVLKQMFYTVV